MAVRSAPSRLTPCAIRFTCALIALAIEFALRPANLVHAQQVRVLPSQQKPSAENLPRNQSAPSQEESVPKLSTLPVMSGGRGSNTREIPLPEIFRGCWAGEVPGVDLMTPLTAAATHVQWLTKLYTLCYKQVGGGDRWRLTFVETSVAQRSMVSDQRQSISVKSVAGRDRAELTA